MKVTVYTQAGAEQGTVEIADAVFGAKWNDALVSQVVRAMEANARTPVAHAKDRAEVRGGGRKPWKQKGTGRARHGSIRSPIWVGGGKAHGPLKMRDYSQKINKAMRAKALYSALSAKVREGKVVFMDTLSFDAPKTKEAITVLAKIAKAGGHKDLATRKTNGVLIAVSGAMGNVLKSYRNLGNVEVLKTADLNPVTVLKYKYVIMTEPVKGSATLEARISKAK